MFCVQVFLLSSHYKALRCFEQSTHYRQTTQSPIYMITGTTLQTKLLGNKKCAIWLAFVLEEGGQGDRKLRCFRIFQSNQKDYKYTIRISRYEFDIMLSTSTVECNLLYVRVPSYREINPLSHYNTGQYVVYAAELIITGIQHFTYIHLFIF